MTNNQIIVVGGGIAGLTATALLAHEGLDVTLFEAHFQTGGCAGTFKRSNYIFDVGATQVAGLEEGGIHQRIFKHLEWPIPSAKLLDPACVVDLGDGSRPIHLWQNPLKWRKERTNQFPGSERFWTLCHFLHKRNWSVAQANPILPIANFWDFRQLLSAINPLVLLSGFFSRSSVSDLLYLCACNQDERLKKFLDLQLKLYSQEFSDNTAALYGATVLQIAQAPLGLFHLMGSMQTLSDDLEACLLRDGGKLLLRHKVVQLYPGNKDLPWEVDVIDNAGSLVRFNAADIIFTLPPQCLLDVIPQGTGLPTHYQNRLEELPQPSGAITFYGAIERKNLRKINSSHFQFLIDDIGSLFVSISQDGDGRAPLGEATVIASAFTEVDLWMSLNASDYQMQKKAFLEKIMTALNFCFDISSEKWLHCELGTPRSFAKWTGRPNGIVGGLGQSPDNFGPFGLSSRTPMRGLWLCGDSIYPGEGTAGVAQSAFMACRQLLANRGKSLTLCI